MPNPSESPCNNIAGYPRQFAGVGNSLKITGPLIDHKAANAISNVIRFVWAERVSSLFSVSARPDSSAQAFSVTNSNGGKAKFSGRSGNSHSMTAEADDLADRQAQASDGSWTRYQPFALPRILRSRTVP